MIEIRITPGSLRQVERLQRQNRLLLEALEQRQTTPLGRLVAYLSRNLADAAQENAPEDTGALKAAHWADITPNAARGTVFLNPSVTNPKSGGQPSIYGPVVHQRDPWFAQTMGHDLVGILEEGAGIFLDELCAIHESVA